jgi:hypothetical protein
MKPSVGVNSNLMCSRRSSFIKKASVSHTYVTAHGETPGWVSPWHFGINEGPVVLMIENHRSGLLWELMRDCPYLALGLKRAGFSATRP